MSNADRPFGQNAMQREVDNALGAIQEVTLVDRTGTVSVLDSSVGGRTTTALAAAAAATVIKATPGRLARVLVTAAGTAPLLFYDNASAATGTVIGFIPTTTAAGQVYDLQLPAAFGIYSAGGAGTPGVTVSFY